MIVDATNWLNDHSSDSLTLGSLVSDDGLDNANASVFLSSILVLKMGKWIL